MKRVIALFSMLTVSLPALGRTINWGSEFGSVNLESDGITPISDAFTIQLGAFDPGFIPSGANVDLWAANWNVFDQLLPNEHFSAAGYFTSEPELLNNLLFAQGQQAYVWM